MKNFEDLWQAVIKNDKPKVIELLESMPQDVFKMTKEEMTVIHLAASLSNKDKSKDNNDIVKALVEKAPAEALTIRDSQGNTPLHISANTVNYEVLSTIMEKSPDVAFIRRNKSGDTPIAIAATSGSEFHFPSAYFGTGVPVQILVLIFQRYKPNP